MARVSLENLKKVYPDGTVAVEGFGKYMKLPLDQIADFDAEREEWYVRPD